MGGLFGGYACTRGFLLIIGAIILLGAAIAMRTLASSVGFMITFWVFIPLLFLAFGLILIFNNPTAGWQVIIVGIIIAILFCTAPTTKLLFVRSLSKNNNEISQIQSFMMSMLMEFLSLTYHQAIIY